MNQGIVSHSTRHDKRRISLRWRVLLIIAIVTVLLMGTLYGITSVILENRFHVVEWDDGEESTQRVLQVLAQEMVALDASVKDWAWWDDTYAYAEDGNEAYLNDNLTASAIAVLRLNWLEIIDTEGKVVFGAHYDPGTDTLSPLDPNRLQDLGLWPLPAKGGVGLVVGADGPLLAAFQPILPSNEDAPPTGTLLFGRSLDPAFLENLSRVTLYPISLLPLDPLQAPVNVSVSEEIEPSHGTPLLTALDDEHLASDTTLLDLSGRPAVQMRITIPRPILSEARSALLAQLLSLLALGLFFVLLTSWILDRYFLRRLDRLSAEVQRIGRGKGDPAALLIGGNDEIALLAQTVRETLAGLQNSERRYRELVENLAEGIAVIDKADAFLYLNPACERIFGLPAGDLLGHSAKEFIDPAEHEAVDRQISRCRNEESSQYENTILRPDGSRRRLLISSVPQYDSRGQVSGTLSIILDITEQRQVEEAIQKARTDLLFAVSHEMKTPLMSLAASREILETLPLAEKERRTPEYEAMWSHNLARLRRLIDNLVDSQRTQTIGMQLKCEPSDLNSLVRGVLAETAGLSAHQELRFELSLAELPAVYLDREATSRLVENLVINAVKFSPRGGLISLHTSLESDRACLTISDQGPGIASEEIAFLFQPFQRSPEAVKSGVQGTGLGLYVSKMIAEAHGGSVGLESRAGQGTTVRVRLPLAPSNVCSASQGGNVKKIK
ncbi:MAG: PAS domain S-box protein [Coprothermobacterota bacterium]|nr:PAS domain S-box protein [Coprothermobacterota bacterium]